MDIDLDIELNTDIDIKMQALNVNDNSFQNDENNMYNMYDTDDIDDENVEDNEEVLEITDTIISDMQKLSIDEKQELMYDLFDNNNLDDIITKIDETLEKINILQNKEIINNSDEILQEVIEIKGGADTIKYIDYTMLKTQYETLKNPKLKYFKTEEQSLEDIKKDMIIIEQIKNNYSIKELDFINKLFTNPNILFIYSIITQRL